MRRIRTCANLAHVPKDAPFSQTKDAPFSLKRHAPFSLREFEKDAPNWPCENGASKMRRIRGRRRGRHAPNSPSEKGASFSRCSETPPDFGHFYKRCAILALRKRRIFEWRISRIFFEASYMTKIAKKMRRFRE